MEIIFWKKNQFNKIGINKIKMTIIVRLDVVLAQQKMSLPEFSKRVNVSIKNLSLLKKKWESESHSIFNLKCNFQRNEW